MTRRTQERFYWPSGTGGPLHSMVNILAFGRFHDNRGYLYACACSWDELGLFRTLLSLGLSEELAGISR